MSFFGPGGLASGGASNQLDPQLIAALQKQFPQLAGQQQPNSLSTLGYSYPGVQLYSGQGTGSFGNALSPFESAGGVSPESITGGLAMGSFGKSSSQQPVGQGGGVGGFGNLSLPSLSLPMAQVAASQAGASDQGLGGTGAEGGGPTGAPSSGGIGVTDILGAGQNALNYFTGQGQTTGPQTPGMQDKLAGERVDYTNATGSPSGIPQGFNLGALTPTLQPTQSFPAGTTLSTDTTGMGVMQPTLQTQQSLPPDTTFSMPGAGETMSAPGGSAQTALGTGGIFDNANVMGAAQSGFGALSGGLNLLGGIQSGNPLMASMGGLQTVGGVSGLLQNLPGLADKLNLSSGALQGVGGAVGGIGGAYSLYQGIQSGDPMQIAGGLASLYGGASSLVNQVAGTQLMPALTDLAIQAVAAVSPAAAQAVATAISSVASAAGAWAGPIAAVVTAVLDTVAEMDRERVQNAGFTNNPIKGALYSASTANVKKVNDMVAQITGQGGPSALTTPDLATNLGQGMNDLMAYYATAQGGREAIRASDTITGRGVADSSKAWAGGQSPAEYTQNFTNAQQGVRDLLSELQNRGVTYEQLGQIPVTGGWVDQTLDAYNPLNDLYAGRANEYNAQAQPLLQRAVQGLQQGGLNNEYYILPANGENQQYIYANQLTPEALFKAAQGAAAISPDNPLTGNVQSNLITQMYGGPLWAAAARMFSPGDPLQAEVQQHFNPWGTIQNFTPTQLQAALFPNAGVQVQGPAAVGGTNDWYQQQIQQQAQQRALQNPQVQALTQYMQQLSSLQNQLPQLTGAAQTASAGGLDPQLVAMLSQQGAPGFAGGNGAFSPTGGGGGTMDLAALLQQLGYAPQGQPVAA